MTYLADPGGRFASDTHRRVLGHLSYPNDDYGWTAQALVERMRPDVGTEIYTPEEMQSVLEDLEADGHAQKQGNIWQMTDSGLDVLNGPIENEPGPSGQVEAPAQIGAATTINGSSSGPAGSSPTGETE